MAWVTGYDFSNGCRNKNVRYCQENLDQTPEDRPYRRSLKKVSPGSPIIKNLTSVFDEMSKRSPPKPLSTEFLPPMSKHLDDSPLCQCVTKQSKEAQLSSYESHKARVMKAWYEDRPITYEKHIFIKKQLSNGKFYYSYATQDDLEHLAV